LENSEFAKFKTLKYD